jgi:hypothetical protein
MISTTYIPSLRMHHKILRFSECMPIQALAQEWECSRSSPEQGRNHGGLMRKEVRLCLSWPSSTCKSLQDPRIPFLFCRHTTCWKPRQALHIGERLQGEWTLSEITGQRERRAMRRSSRKGKQVTIV